ncbi:ABC transporter ATP-binding protein [Propionibacterium australiense]|uniref:ABC transporter n=1 Tax=Propionibacterium australiense TaxID=119981 RepID=A0A383S462_9ACTN|nr:ATP-binding cassette domain-containing protein [Propionibacterium australiense]RLP11140.1 ATP-binding cassette domain-containing protein [Propionibacterium australiense]RLP12468.1 ATP-binding cassette domain-containing protein [Propionibacterium australiense]SYZ32717.1 ABC transporter [Propionibacterium australiense]VEH91484.1 Daunorubicin/doxorubicin resistance ATP-binding protein DrrA [Propionibacterium australiense]
MFETRHLTRRFGDLVAVDDVSFQVPDGATVGFIGGNGAGKTTTMRMIMGLLAPDAGETLWNGAPITAAERRTIGYMPEERGLYPKQQVLDQLVYLARLRGATAAAARAEAMQLLEAFGLGERVKEKLEKLSLGNQQRVQIAAAVMAEPAALILDEPFSGLDPDAVDSLSEVLSTRTAVGVPLLFSSHQLDLVERLCDRLVILAHGRVVADGTGEELRSRGTARHRLVMDTDTGWVRDMAGLSVLDVDGPRALLVLDDDAARRALLTEALARGEVRELAEIRPTLAEIYREVTR